jgi:GntR family transcriptional repressor for pyruvate dehydrogenase complex
VEEYKDTEAAKVEEGRKDGRFVFEPLKTKRAFEEISAEIKRLIFSDKLKPGDRLPSEIELANQFGVSRHTIREALRGLEIAGFVSVQKGGSGGPLIVDTILNTISQSFLDAFQMKKLTIDELTKARLEIEKMVLKNVFGAIDGNGVALLRENVQASKDKIEKKIPTFENDLLFHKLLARSTNNYLFVIFIDAMTAMIGHFQSFLRVGVRVSRRVVYWHEQIVDAIEAGDEDSALSLLEQHIMEVDRAYKSLGKRIEAEPERTGAAL